MAIVNWHKEIENDQLHAPKDFSLATKGDLFWKDGFNEIEYLQMPVLPAVLDLVTASSAPPSEVHGNRYVLIDTTAVNAAWDGAQQNDWVEYDSSADVWVNITPEEGAVVYDKDTDTLYKFDGSTWSSASGSSGSFVKTDGTTPLTADWDAGAYEITAESLKVDGTGGDGHFHMRYQSAIPTGAANNSKLFAGATGALGWVVDSNAYAFYLDMTGNTASRTLTVPNASGTIALTSDITNVSTDDMVIDDNARYIRLKAGYTTTQYFQIQNTGGENFIKFLGDGTIEARGQYRFNAASNGGQELYVIRARSYGGFEKVRVQAEDNQGIIDIWGNQSYQLISLNSTSTSYFYNSLIVGDATIDASALFQVKSTSKGFLPPVMSATQAEAISSPAEGLLVYSTNGTGSTITSKGWWGYDGSAWNKLN